MTGPQTPSTALLLDWLEHRLSAEEATDLARFVENDPALQAQVAWLRDFLDISHTTVLVDPPASIRRAADAHFAAYAQDKRSPGLLRSVIATLSADNWQRLSLAGVRNVTLRTDPRQLIYHSDLADVALTMRVQASGAQIDLDGQVFPLDDSDPAGFVVQLLQDAIECRLTTCDTVGKFSLTGLAAGGYEVVVSGGQGEIEIGPLELA